MSVQYEKALKLWGVKKLKEKYSNLQGFMVDVNSVTVEMNFDEGNNCCGGSDPNCYCSLAESPSADVCIRAMASQNNCGIFQVIRKIDCREFDFVEVLGEIVEAGDGEISSEETKKGGVQGRS